MTTPKSLDEYTMDARRMEPDESNFYTRLDLDAFANRIVENGPEWLLIPFGKSYFLFNEILQGLHSHGLDYSILKPLSFPKTVMAFGISERCKTERVALIVDSIDDGEEVAYLHETLKDSSVGFTKIYSYLTNADGLKKLEKERFPIEMIISHRIVERTKYKENYNRIQIYLQSRIEPMVEGAPYHKYMVFRPMDENNFLTLANKAIRTALLCEDIEIVEDDWLHVAKGIHGYSFECTKVNSCARNRKLFKSIPHIGKLDFEAFKVGTKVQCREHGITFRIAILCPIDCTLEGIVPALVETCPYGKLADCELTKFPKRHQTQVRNTVCSLCINRVVSEHILNKIRAAISHRLKAERIEFSCRRFKPT